MFGKEVSHCFRVLFWNYKDSKLVDRKPYGKKSKLWFTKGYLHDSLLDSEISNDFRVVWFIILWPRYNAWLPFTVSLIQTLLEHILWPEAHYLQSISLGANSFLLKSYFVLSWELFTYLCIRERGSTCVERLWSRLGAEREAPSGTGPRGYELAAWAETSSRLFGRLSHPGAPKSYSLF